MKFAEWIRPDYAACETKEYRDLAELCAQQHEAIAKRHRYDFLAHMPGHDCAKNAEAGNLDCIAIQAAEEFQEKYQ